MFQNRERLRNPFEAQRTIDEAVEHVNHAISRQDVLNLFLSNYYRHLEYNRVRNDTSWLTRAELALGTNGWVNANLPLMRAFDDCPHSAEYRQLVSEHNTQSDFEDYIQKEKAKAEKERDFYTRLKCLLFGQAAQDLRNVAEAQSVADSAKETYDAEKATWKSSSDYKDFTRDIPSDQSKLVSMVNPKDTKTLVRLAEYFTEVKKFTLKDAEEMKQVEEKEQIKASQEAFWSDTQKIIESIPSPIRYGSLVFAVIIGVVIYFKTRT